MAKRAVGEGMRPPGKWSYQRWFTKRGALGMYEVHRPASLSTQTERSVTPRSAAWCTIPAVVPPPHTTSEKPPSAGRLPNSPGGVARVSHTGSGSPRTGSTGSTGAGAGVGVGVTGSGSAGPLGSRYMEAAHPTTPSNRTRCHLKPSASAVPSSTVSTDPSGASAT